MVGSYFLFSDGLPQHAARSIQALWDLGHVLYFCLFTILILKAAFFNQQPYFVRCILIILLTLLLGIAIEALQYGTTRSTDWGDVAHDLLGSLIILAFYRPTLPHSKTKALLTFKILVFLMGLFSLWPLASALFDEAYARFQFPVLSDFSSPLEIKRWNGSADYKIEKNTSQLRIQFNTQTYSSIHLVYFNHDWSRYKNLILKIENPNQGNLFVTIKIYDKKHTESYHYTDRFNRKIKILPGLNTISISLNDIKTAPRSRLMDLKKIDSLSIFSIRYPKPEVLYLNSVYLSP